MQYKEGIKMNFKDWQQLSPNEANTRLLKMIKDKDFIKKVSIHPNGCEQIKYSDDEKAVSNFAAIVGRDSSIYSEDLAYEIIIDFIKSKPKFISDWLISELASIYFIYTANKDVGFIIDKDGNRLETRYLRIHLEKDLEEVGKIGFIVTAISPIP